MHAIIKDYARVVIEARNIAIYTWGITPDAMKDYSIRMHGGDERSAMSYLIRFIASEIAQSRHPFAHCN